MSSDRFNLLNAGLPELCAFFTEMGEPKFRAKQLFQWIHQRGVIDLSEMTNLSKTLRTHLEATTTLTLPVIVQRQNSLDGTRKWLLSLEDASAIEMVYIPEGRRGTLCVSSQVGCALNCQFCATATRGFKRNLNIAEIIGQVWLARHELRLDSLPLTNVVMMGMGEPLLNFDAVVSAMNIMMDDLAYGLSKHRVTLSTSGVVPKLIELSQVSPVALAISLHAPNNPLRTELVPINKKYPLEMLLEVCRNYFSNEPHRRITFEYVMLRGVNDSLEHAQQLIACLSGIPAKINLIPFNPFPQARYACSEPEVITQFQQRLHKAGFVTIIRKTRGADIDAACGQLVGDFQDRTNRSARWAASNATALAV